MTEACCFSRVSGTSSCSGAERPKRVARWGHARRVGPQVKHSLCCSSLLVLCEGPCAALLSVMAQLARFGSFEAARRSFRFCRSLARSPAPTRCGTASTQIHRHYRRLCPCGLCPRPRSSAPTRSLAELAARRRSARLERTPTLSSRGWSWERRTLLILHLLGRAARYPRAGACSTRGFSSLSGHGLLATTSARSIVCRSRPPQRCFSLLMVHAEGSRLVPA